MQLKAQIEYKNNFIIIVQNIKFRSLRDYPITLYPRNLMNSTNPNFSRALTLQPQEEAMSLLRSEAHEESKFTRQSTQGPVFLTPLSGTALTNKGKRTQYLWMNKLFRLPSLGQLSRQTTAGTACDEENISTSVMMTDAERVKRIILEVSPEFKTFSEVLEVVLGTEEEELTEGEEGIMIKIRFTPGIDMTQAESLDFSELNLGGNTASVSCQSIKSGAPSFTFQNDAFITRTGQLASLTPASLKQPQRMSESSQKSSGSSSSLQQYASSNQGSQRSSAEESLSHGACLVELPPFTYIKGNLLCPFIDCTKTFKECGNLKTHLRSHLSLRDFTCEHCGKQFKLKQHLKNHEKSHFEASLIPCTIEGCTKRFTRRNRLDLHLKAVHSGLKLFKCTVAGCSRAFSEKGNLMVHLRTHTGEKPYECKYCQRVFTSVGNKKDHERRHQNQSSYKPLISLLVLFNNKVWSLAH
ncbi:hypothetical protein FGO68_gene372 [Halteria grandinella]|uniref:C2H2-type domain-containing protein n=1 Tax=Halteria grandinella TaxID=5974 RepID=A0A8J8P287_HALGN|nr:hypothetical protein FGO68_gene372 [Halteria grandinella]